MGKHIYPQFLMNGLALVVNIYIQAFQQKIISFGHFTTPYWALGRWTLRYWALGRIIAQDTKLKNVLALISKNKLNAKGSKIKIK